MNKIINTRKHHNGFTMIEILITVVVVSIGLLGLAGLQMSGLRANMGSESRSIATLTANDIAERMRANPLGSYADIDSDTITAGDGCATAPDPFCSNNGGGVTLVTGSTGCTPDDMAAFDAWVWACGLPVATGVQRGGLTNKLLNGAGNVVCAADTCTVTVTWDALNQDRSDDATTTATISHSYSLVLVP
jgi:type IV pilus assembly protein PilV